VALHVAAMPDLHVAHGVAVGTVFATADVVVPAALGSDLGCGMSAVRFDDPASLLSKATLGQSAQAKFSDRRSLDGLPRHCIGKVLEDEEGLVRPLLRLEPIAVVKG
jgi:RNA-splicing ligase RtcB